MTSGSLNHDWPNAGFDHRTYLPESMFVARVMQLAEHAYTHSLFSLKQQSRDYGLPLFLKDSMLRRETLSAAINTFCEKLLHLNLTQPTLHTRS